MARSGYQVSVESMQTTIDPAQKLCHQHRGQSLRCELLITHNNFHNDFCHTLLFAVQYDFSFPDPFPMLIDKQMHKTHSTLFFTVIPHWPPSINRPWHFILWRGH